MANLSQFVSLSVRTFHSDPNLTLIEERFANLALAHQMITSVGKAFSSLTGGAAQQLRGSFGAILERRLDDLDDALIVFGQVITGLADYAASQAILLEEDLVTQPAPPAAAARKGGRRNANS